MKKLSTIVVLIIVSSFAAAAQNNQAEQEILKFNTDYFQAITSRDVAFLERVYADDFVSSTEGSSENRTQALDYFRQEKTKPRFRMFSLKSEDVKVRVTPNTAIITGAAVVTFGMADDEKAEPHTDRGRYTMILEKRDGRWMLVAEHTSEAPHDRKLMEQNVLKLRQGIVEIMKSRDTAAAERVLDEKFVFTNERGDFVTRAQLLGNFKNPDDKLDSAEFADQKVQVTGNNTALETGSLKLKGSYQGKPYDVVLKYTTVWGFSRGRWRMLAEHVSEVRR